MLKEPFGAFLQHLAYDQGFAVSPAALKKYGKDIAKNPVGTGPYRFESQVPGQSITLTRPGVGTLRDLRELVEELRDSQCPRRPSRALH